MKQHYDIGIIGAGPIGGYLAAELSKNNYSIALFEQHKEIGIPMNCAGLITPRVFDTFSIPKQNIIHNEIQGAHIHSPSGYTLSIGGDKTHAVSIDRTAFDRYLVEIATKRKTELYLGEKIVSIQSEKDSVELVTADGKKTTCSILIGADGPFSKVRDLYGFPQPREYLRGIGAIVENMSLNPSFVEIFVGNRIAPGFFAWMIPINRDGTKARIGLCISREHKKSPQYYFQNMFKEFPTASFLKSAQIIEKTGGIIPLGPLSQTVKDNILLVGDAAAQVKPTSGGGIYMGLVSANHCVAIINESKRKEGFSTDVLHGYHQAWRKDIGKELYMGMQFRRIYGKLTDGDFDKYIQKFNTPSIIKIITERGDIDYPSALLRPLLKKIPTLIRLLPRII
jgi:digeranylgeranylglycerophospholipid reductase